MRESRMSSARLKPTLLACLVVLVVAGCSSANLGDIDETQSERDDMPGPGILADENGETTLKWVADTRQPEEQPVQSPAKLESEQLAMGVESEQTTATEVQPAPAPTMDEKAEFEAFKEWNRLRSEGANSAEYQEFLMWLEYQQFKN